SDFGLAFDGHWSHDAAYYRNHRYSLALKLGLDVHGDEEDRKKQSTLQQTAGNAHMTMLYRRRHDRSAMYFDGPAANRGRHQKGSAGLGFGGANSSTPLLQHPPPGGAKAVKATEPLLDWRCRHGNRSFANSAVGTYQYMAPEVIMGQRYDGRCDWWSVGIIMYE